MPEQSCYIKSTTNYRITVDEAITNVNSLFDIIDNNKSNGTMTTMSAKTHYLVIKNVNVVTSKPKNAELTLMNTMAGNTTETDDTLYYIINFENDQGFAFASVSNRFEPVLCLTESYI
jgi:hypothetical protein